jgi:deoxyribonuclease V
MLVELQDWPQTPDELIRIQSKLGAISMGRWIPDDTVRVVAGCWICHPKGHEGRGVAGDSCWAAAALVVEGTLRYVETVAGVCTAAYQAGLLALREGPWLEKAVRLLPDPPDVLLVNATGLDHPRRAGLALHLGAKLSLPTVGVTRRPLIAEGSWPAEDRGSMALLRIDQEVAACRLRTRRRTLPLVVHPAWRTDLEAAVAVVMAATGGRRTPEPLRHARRAAREARAAGGIN